MLTLTFTRSIQRLCSVVSSGVYVYVASQAIWDWSVKVSSLSALNKEKRQQLSGTDPMGVQNLYKSLQCLGHVAGNHYLSVIRYSKRFRLKSLIHWASLIHRPVSHRVVMVLGSSNLQWSSSRGPFSPTSMLSHPVLKTKPDIHYMWNKEVKSHI
jgi:hypothetical protein